MARTLVALRHGETEFNLQGRMQGHLDIALTENGRAGARRAAVGLQHYPVRKIVSSDLSRARETAEIVGAHLGLPVTTDERLRETFLGNWQGMDRDQIDAQYPGARARWRNDINFAPPGGESHVQVRRRTRTLVDELMNDFPDWEDGAVLLVSHGGAINALVHDLLGLTSLSHTVVVGLKNTCWAELKALPALATQAQDEQGNVTSTIPTNVDHTTTFTAANVDTARWFLGGWNMGSFLEG